MMRGRERRCEMLGDEPPLSVDGREKDLDRRDISARWLTGAVLTGVTSTLLMGIALIGALDGRQAVGKPQTGWERSNVAEGPTTRGDRVVRPQPLVKAGLFKRIEVATLVRSADGSSQVVRPTAFGHAQLSLAAGYHDVGDYPSFDPLAMFAPPEGGEGESAPAESITVRTGRIYDMAFEGDVDLRLRDFPIGTDRLEERGALSTQEVEEIVRDNSVLLADGNIQVAALPFIDPQRFGENLVGPVMSLPLNVRVVPENISVAHPGLEAPSRFLETILPITTDQSPAEALIDGDYEIAAESAPSGEEAGDQEEGQEDEADAPSETEAAETDEASEIGDPSAVRMAEALSILLKGEDLKRGQVLRLGRLHTADGGEEIVRASLYRGTDHIITVARDDRGQYVAASEPERTSEFMSFVADRPVDEPDIQRAANLPDAYDALYRAGRAEGLTDAMTTQLIRLFSGSLDYRAPVHPRDRVDVLYTEPDESGSATDQSALLYVDARFDGVEKRYYRYTTLDGQTDFFDSEGRSARSFLIRNPVPTGKFRSGFGKRRHPVLGYMKMHTGVDWAAPRGTPILAAGDGVVEKAGWAGGYGRQTIIRHANGYKTSYNHQNKFASGITAGAKVRQGQVIGFIGSTGLSTGPHLHYELIVNGTKVDPMRVRLPDSHALEGAELAAFESERERIDHLLQSRQEGLQLVSR